MASGLYAGQNVDDVYKTMRERLYTNVVSHVTNRLPDGRVIVATIQPRADGGWVVTHQDVTERETLNAQLARQNGLLKQREEELKAQNERFNAAINNMSQGMSLFDSEQRVVFANRRFAEIYGLAPEEVRPGTTLRQILAARGARGVYNNIDAAKFVDEGVASFRQEVSHIVHLADGRFISVVRRPMADGGLVSTHEDVTEREKLNARLAAQNDLSRRQEEELKAQNERFDTALKNMSHGLCMFDGEQRVLIANQRYAEIYGLTPDQVKPGTTLRQIVEYPHRQRALRRRHVLRITSRSVWQNSTMHRSWCTTSATAASISVRAPADARRRLGLDARGHHRAPEAQGGSSSRIRCSTRP